jgi:hypothetical protein
VVLARRGRRPRRVGPRLVRPPRGSHPRRPDLLPPRRLLHLPRNPGVGMARLKRGWSPRSTRCAPCSGTDIGGRRQATRADPKRRWCSGSSARRTGPPSSGVSSSRGMRLRAPGRHAGPDRRDGVEFP